MLAESASTWRVSITVNATATLQIRLVTVELWPSAGNFTPSVLTFGADSPDLWPVADGSAGVSVTNNSGVFNVTVGALDLMLLVGLGGGGGGSGGHVNVALLSGQVVGGLLLDGCGAGLGPGIGLDLSSALAPACVSAGVGGAYLAACSFDVQRTNDSRRAALSLSLSRGCCWLIGCLLVDCVNSFAASSAWASTQLAALQAIQSARNSADCEPDASATPAMLACSPAIQCDWLLRGRHACMQPDARRRRC